MIHYTKFKTLYVNPSSAHTTRSVDWYTFSCVKEWFESQGKDYRTEVRGYRTNKNGEATFKTGVGYDWIDKDLLGGNGNGQARKAFEEAYDIQL